MLIGMLVVVYLFVGGSGAGALFVTCAWSLAFHRREDRTFVVTEAFEGLKRKGLFVGVALVVVSSVFLLLDLGRPELFFLLFARPTPTPISFGSFFLAADILLGAFLLVASLPFGAAVPTLAKKAAEVLCLAVFVRGDGVYRGLRRRGRERRLVAYVPHAAAVRAVVAFGGHRRAAGGGFAGRRGAFPGKRRPFPAQGPSGDNRPGASDDRAVRRRGPFRRGGGRGPWPCCWVLRSARGSSWEWARSASPCLSCRRSSWPGREGRALRSPWASPA